MFDDEVRVETDRKVKVWSSGVTLLGHDFYSSYQLFQSVIRFSWYQICDIHEAYFVELRTLIILIDGVFNVSMILLYSVVM